jgi:hypothetical protein
MRGCSTHSTACSFLTPAPVQPNFPTFLRKPEWSQTQTRIVIFTHIFRVYGGQFDRRATFLVMLI